LEADPTLDKVGRYGRHLRYVYRNGVNANIQMVRVGAAALYFYRSERGRYADRLVAAVMRAKAAKRRLRGACPRTGYDPYHAVDITNRSQIVGSSYIDMSQM